MDIAVWQQRRSHAESFQFGPGVTHGIKDLAISSNSSAEAGKHTVYAFDGEVYKEVKKAR